MARILIADDAAIMRKNLRMILVQAGHTVIAEASDGAQAFEEYVRHLPDLVTLDINMPFVNGIDAMKKILKDYPDAKIIVISSANNNHIILEAIQNGAKNYIMKPFMVEKVINVVNQVLQVNDRVNSDTVQKIYRNMEATSRTSFDNPIITYSEEKQLPSQELSAITLDTKTSGAAPQFAIEVRSNAFVISIDESIEGLAFEKLYNAMQGFLMVKPLKIVLNLQNIEKLPEEYLEKLIDYINLVKNVEGLISVVSQKEAVVQFFKNKGVGWFTNFYSHMSQVKYF